MARCPECGKNSRDDTSSCEYCGADLAPPESRDSGTPAAKPAGEDFESEVLDLMRQKQKIAAIKVYREATGTGLKDAKEAVEALAEQHGIPASSAGCAGMLAFIIIGVSVFVAALRFV